jgi:hypothetical protein
MDEMKKQALEKLMMVLDEILGSDVKGRMHGEEKPSEETSEHESEESPEAENVEEVLEGAMGEETAGEHGKGPKGVGLEVEQVKVAAMPKPGLMKKMRGMK